MKRQLLLYLAATAVMFAGCGESEKGGETGYGTVRLVCAADAAIETAVALGADDAPTPGDDVWADAPDGSDFRLTLAGEGTETSWETLAAFASENPLIKEGSYTATVTYGDPGAEGPGKPCFTGSEPLVVRARKTSECSVTARLSNAQTVVRTTQRFLDYYHDIRFTLTTGAGNAFTFAPDAEGYAEIPVYVRAGGSLSVAGTARRQSQTGTDAGIAVTFDPVTVDAAEARKRHIFTFDFSQGGGTTLTIEIGTDYTEEVDVECELNEEARISKIHHAI